MFGRKGTDLPRNKAPATMNRPLLKDRPVTDNKSANSTLSRHPTVLGIKTGQNNAATKTTAARGIASRLNKTEVPSTSGLKPKLTSAIGQKGTLKDQVELNVKRKREYLSKYKEVTEQIAEATTEIETLRSSTTKEDYEKKLAKFEESQKKFEELCKLFTKHDTKVNNLLLKISQCEKSVEQKLKTIVSLNNERAKHKENMLKESTNNVKLEEIWASDNKELRGVSKEIEDLQKVTHEVFQDNLNLHNSIYSMKGKVQVFCRIRPKLANEENESLMSIIYNDECGMSVGKTGGLSNANSNRKASRKECVFDKVFPPAKSTRQLFEDVRCFFRSAVEGQSVCVFLYGPKRSGKSFTLEGLEDNKEEGLLCMMAAYIFENIKVMEITGWNYKTTVQCSYANKNATEEICEEEIDSAESLVSCYFNAKQQSEVASSFVMQIHFEASNSCLSKSSNGVLNIVEISVSEEYLPKAIRKFAKSDPTDEICKASPVVQLLAPFLKEQSKIAVVLHIPPTMASYTESMSVIDFGNEVVACRMQQSRKQIKL